MILIRHDSKFDTAGSDGTDLANTSSVVSTNKTVGNKNRFRFRDLWEMREFPFLQ